MFLLDVKASKKACIIKACECLSHYIGECIPKAGQLLAWHGVAPNVCEPPQSCKTETLNAKVCEITACLHACIPLRSMAIQYLALHHNIPPHVKL